MLGVAWGNYIIVEDGKVSAVAEAKVAVQGHLYEATYLQHLEKLILASSLMG